MIREYKLNTAGQLDLGWRDVEFWLSLFPNLTQADLDNPRLFTPNLESMVEPKKKEQEWEILVISFEDTNHLFIPNGEGRFFHCKHFSENQSGWTQDELLNHKTKEYRIHTVKRLSDGETFSVGDKIDSVTQPHFNNLPIKEFVIIGETLTANVHKFEASHGYKLSDIKKSQQPPQEEQKDNYVFVWDDAKVKDAVELAWLTGVTKNGIAPKKFIDDFKASKSTLASEKITLEWVALHEGKHNYNLVVPSGIDIDKVEQVKKAIWNVLNNYPNPEFGKAAYERLFDQNQQILEENSKMYVDTQKKLREAFEAARIGSRSISDKDGQMIGGFTYKDFDSYLQSLNNK